jgi:signal transduction histidine kinase
MADQGLNADQLIQYLTWAVYALLFVLVATRAIRHPLRANVDIALFFLLFALVIANSLAGRLQIVPNLTILNIISTSLLLALPYMLLRLLDDFAQVPVLVVRSAEIGLALAILATIYYTYNRAAPPPGSPFPSAIALLMIAYLVGFFFYTVVAFIRESHRSSGVTMRRMFAVALGSIFLCLIFLVAALRLVFPNENLSGLWTALSDVFGLASAVSYFLGFTPPRFLRRAWQEPELRAFLGRAARLPRLPTTEAILREMERGAATSVGAPNSLIGLWDEDAQVIRFTLNGERIDFLPVETTPTGQAFHHQRAVFTDNLERDSSAYNTRARQLNVRALLAAPITAGQKRLGVLTVYAPRAPIFADEDLELVQLLADQAAVILESRALIDEAARVQAREEVARLKDDFLSTAAHDLKTPLTTLVASAQLLERRVARSPQTPVDLVSIQKIVREAQRLKNLVLELLDATRTEQGRLLGELTEVDLAELARETCARHNSDRHPCSVQIEGPVVGSYDAMRIAQLMENLVENAVKYSPQGGAVTLKVRREGEWNHISVRDEGIGIRREDLSLIFERFHRGANVDDRRFTGMGLGLFICRGIAEQHGGRIWVESGEGSGSTFHVALPASVALPVPSEVTASAS